MAKKGKGSAKAVTAEEIAAGVMDAGMAIGALDEVVTRFEREGGRARMKGHTSWTRCSTR